MKNYHLFISHSWGRADQYNNLINSLNQAKDFCYHDRSIPKDDPVHVGSDRELSEAIRNKMESCGILLVLANVNASDSKWVEKELNFAKSSFTGPKPILAIKPWEDAMVSQIIKDKADLIVDWNPKDIISAIEELA